MDDAGNQDKLTGLSAALGGDFERLNAAQDDWIERLGNARGLLRSLAGALEKHKAESLAFQESTLAELVSLKESLGAGAATAELDARIAELEQELSETSSAAQEQAARIGELEEALSTTQKSLDAAKLEVEDFAHLQQEAAELREAERALKNELANLRPQAEQAGAHKDALQAQLSALESEVLALKSSLEEATAGRDEYEARLAELESERASAQGSLEAALERAATAEKQLAEAMEQAALAETDLTQAQESREQALAAQEEFAEQLGQLQKQLDAERAKLRTYEEQLDDEKSKGTKASLAAQLADALSEVEEARTEARELRRALESAQAAASAAASAPAKVTRRSSEEELNLVRKAAESKGGGKFTIGELLVNAGLVSQEQVEQAIDEQRQDRHQHIGAILVNNGLASEDAVAQALAYQCNVEFVRLSNVDVDSASTGLISERLANQHHCIPISSDDTTMTLAMVNPLDLVAIEDIERSSSRKVEVVVGTPREIKDAINKFYWEPN